MPYELLGEQSAFRVISRLAPPSNNSLVFNAEKKNPLTDKWRVVLKVVWDVETARLEARDLMEMDDIRGVVSLLDYFERPYATIKDVAVFSFLKKLNLKDDHPVGFLATHLVKGRTLVTKTERVPREELPPQPKKDTLLFHARGKWYRQYLCKSFSFHEKIRLVSQVAHTLAEVHERNKKHADIKLENLVFNPETNEVTLVDFGGSAGFGTEGWMTPEHIENLRQGGKTTPIYTKAADIYALGRVIERLFEGDGEKGRRVIELIAEPCLKKTREIDAQFVERETQRYLNAISPKRYLKWAGAAAAIALIWLSIWMYVVNVKSDDIRNERILEALVATIPETGPEQYSLLRKIRFTYYTTGDLGFRDKLTKAAAKINVETGNNIKLFYNMDPAKPNAIYISPEERYIIYDEFVIRVGDFVDETRYVTSFNFKQVTLKEYETGTEQTFQFPEFPMEWIPEPTGSIQIYPSDLIILAVGLGKTYPKKVDARPTRETIVRGVLHASTSSGIMQKLYDYLGISYSPAFGERIFIGDLPCANYFIYEIEDGAYIQTTLENLIQKYRKCSGYDVSTIPNHFSDIYIEDYVHVLKPTTGEDRNDRLFWEDHLKDVLNQLGYDLRINCNTQTVKMEIEKL